MIRWALIPLFLAGLAAPAALANRAWMGQSISVVPDLYTAAAQATPAEPSKAEALFVQAKSAAELGEATQAFRLTTEALLADPQHAEARRVLGYELVDGEWLTPHQAKMRRRGYRWHPRFGWLKPDEVPRYEAGERRIGRRWISADADADKRAAIDNGWTVRTDHFAVTTNHSLDEGVRLAAELEGLFQVWRQRFAGYWLSEKEVKALFAGERAARKKPRPMRVYYHRDEAGYVQHLKRRQPRIAQTLGIYFDDSHQAHFYHSEDTTDADSRLATLYHEATHQLFSENGPGKRGAGREANFWLVEGVACYFEMLAPVAGEPRYTLGNPAQGRLPSAVAGGPALPLAELTPMGQSDLQRLADLPAVYAQSAGIVAMLLHGEDAAPEALTRTLRAVYSGRPDGEELARQTGRSLDTLDRQFRAFLQGFRVAE